jgi:hypothetical protein
MLGLFTAAINFFCNKMDIVIQVLTCDITTYKGGAIWRAVSLIYDSLLAVGIAIAGILIWVGLIESTTRFAELKRPSVMGFFLIEITCLNAILYYTKDLLLRCFMIGQGITEKVMQSVGMVNSDGTSIFQITVPETFQTCINNASWLSNIGIMIIVVIASVWIVVSTLAVLLTVYGRLYNMYLLIAISPLPVSTVISKPTRFVFVNFVKSFLSVTLEAIVMVIALYLFQAFFSSGFNDIMPQYIVDESWLGSSTTNIINGMEAAATGQQTYSPTEAVFTYLAEISFLFALLQSIMKGTDRIVNKIFGL